MADVQVQQTPDSGGSGAAWAVGVIVALLIVVVLWFVFADREASAREETTINVETPAGTQEVPKVDLPERVDVDLPERVDINVNTNPPPKPQPTPKQPQPPQKTGTQ